MAEDGLDADEGDFDEEEAQACATARRGGGRRH